MNDKPNLLKYLTAQSGVIKRLGSVVLLHPTGNSVHALRNATRRVRASLWLLKNSSAHLRFEKLDGELHRLGKALGCVRELDVAILDAIVYRIEPRKLIARRKLAQARLRRLLDPGHRKRILAQLSVLEKTVGSTDAISLRSIRGRLHARMQSRLKGHLRGRVKVHRLRILVKKAQYALEAMGRPVEPIRRLQGILGDVHDLDFLQAKTGKLKKLKNRQRALVRKSRHLAKHVLHSKADRLRS